MAERTFADLEAEYCPPLDPALLSAILSDFDLTIHENVENARKTLATLKESALLEEQLGFDASGTGARDEGWSHQVDNTESSDVLSGETDLTSVSNGLSSLDLDGRLHDAAPLTASDDLESLDEDTKIRLLLEVFPNRVSRNKAQYTLRKCNGRWHSAMEELLNHIYFDEAEKNDDEDRIVAKGIDAFSEDNIVRRGRKGKGKKRSAQVVNGSRASSLPLSPVEPTGSSINKWQASADDIAFLSSRINLPNASLTSIYYANQASLQRTIAAIVKQSIHQDSASDDPILAVNAHDLGLEFPTIAPGYVAALVRLTHPSTAAAHELAKVLTARSQSDGGIQIIPQYAPLNDAETESSWSVQAKRPISNKGSSPDTLQAAALANSYAASRSAAIAQAQAAHRRAKSDRLMGGAAAYYSEVSREYAALSMKASAAAADQLAESQSSPNELDLHGIDVLNGLRISQQKVHQWWTNLGEHRVDGRIGAEQRTAGFKIVVGLGRHSEGGKSKLGPAVSKALRNDGWKVEQAGAVIYVTGRARR